MNIIDIGSKVKYWDYLDCEREGIIVGVIPTEDPDVVYLFIQDLDEELNDEVMNTITGPIRYAEMRLSIDVKII